jgi:hypothetical protein
MAHAAELEARIKALEDIEVIKQLKYGYFRHLDSLNWDGVVDCFTEDAVIDYEPGIKMEGKKDIRQNIKDKLLEHIGVHQGHHPEIKITSDTTATGRWELFVYHYLPIVKKGFRLGGFYDDEYIKERGEWKIKRTKMTLIFFEMWDREPLKRM